MNILCFGDSNTFGSHPEGGRHPREIRWPGRLQTLLGNEHYVIEEGMGGRTTIWDDPLEPNRCGIAALPIALQSHKPLDLVILSLGTNDCKTHLNASPRVITKGMENLCNLVKTFPYGEGYPIPKLLIISPILMGDDTDNCIFAGIDASSAQKARSLAPFYERVATQYDALFLDASKYAFPGCDKLHMTAEGHLALADAVADVIRTWKMEP